MQEVRHSHSTHDNVFLRSCKLVTSFKKRMSCFDGSRMVKLAHVRVQLCNIEAIHYSDWSKRNIRFLNAVA